MATNPLPATVERRLRAQIQIQQRLARELERNKQAQQKPPFVTISRQYGCQAFELAKALSERLKAEFPDYEYVIYDKMLLSILAEQDEMLSEMANVMSRHTKSEIDDWVDSTFSGKPSELKVYRALARTQAILASAGACILIGRGSALTTRYVPAGIHVRLIAPLEWRIDTLRNDPGYDDIADRETIERLDREREGFVRKYLGLDVTALNHYDIVFNNERVATNEQALTLSELVKSRWNRVA